LIAARSVAPVVSPDGAGTQTTLVVSLPASVVRAAAVAGEGASRGTATAAAPAPPRPPRSSERREVTLVGRSWRADECGWTSW